MPDRGGRSFNVDPDAKAGRGDGLFMIAIIFGYEDIKNLGTYGGLYLLQDPQFSAAGVSSFVTSGSVSAVLGNLVGIERTEVPK
ncbi:hypothetical protein AVEN_128827-1 [Araneus ventricosus]|uniref:Uncharacterized protein n=1 Tax=Araneus ventricosus TaxID=182803 RepID=A0A4Y2D1H9_ARAVE|nr:hypothetical protein AVEN_128827-1 [Araneus ventricosus]